MHTLVAIVVHLSHAPQKLTPTLKGSKEPDTMYLTGTMITVPSIEALYAMNLRTLDPNAT